MLYIHIEICIERVIGLIVFGIITLKEKSSKFSSIFLKKETKKNSVSPCFFFGFFLKPSGFYNVFFNRANPGITSGRVYGLNRVVPDTWLPDFILLCIA